MNKNRGVLLNWSLAHSRLRLYTRNLLDVTGGNTDRSHRGGCEDRPCRGRVPNRAAAILLVCAYWNRA